MKKSFVRRMDGIVYQVQNSTFDWATINVSHGKRSIGENKSETTWITLSVVSAYGSWGHHWSHCGPGDWRNFLIQTELDYVMGKFMGQNLRVFDPDESIKEAKREILRLRRKQELTADEAVYDWTVVETLDMGALNSTAIDAHVFVEQLSQTHAFADDYTELVQYQINPLAEAFWNNIWIPWIEYLKEELND